MPNLDKNSFNKCSSRPCHTWGIVLGVEDTKVNSSLPSGVGVGGPGSNLERSERDQGWPTPVGQVGKGISDGGHGMEGRMLLGEDRRGWEMIKLF